MENIATIPVRVAGGDKLYCSQVVKHCQWSCQGHTFTNEFRLLALGTYAGILGLDWLASHSPMIVDWEQKWLSYQHRGHWVTLQGELPREYNFTVMAVYTTTSTLPTHVTTEVQALLDTYSVVFSIPSELPPRRAYDHTIPLIPGARPVAIRPYRVAPHLTTELEQQVQELLKNGLTRLSNSPFSSPVLMVKNKDGSWRMVIY